MLLVIATFALFSSIFTVAKPTLDSGGLFFLLGTRMVVAALLIGLYLLWKRPHVLRLSRSLIIMVLITGTLNFFVTNVFEFLGLAHLPSWKTCFIYNFSPFICAFLSLLLLGERMNGQRWLGLLVGSFGISMIFWPDASGMLAGLWTLGWPEISVLLAVTVSQLGWTLMRKMRLEGVDPLAANCYGMALAGLLCLGVSGATESWQPIPIWDGWTAGWGTTYMLIVSNLLAYNLYAGLLQRFSSTFLALAGGMTSLFAALWGWLFLGEVVHWIMLPAACIGTAGLMIYYRQELQQRPWKVGPVLQATEPAGVS